MRLFVEIPCLDEEKALPLVLVSPLVTAAAP